MANRQASSKVAPGGSRRSIAEVPVRGPGSSESVERLAVAARLLGFGVWELQPATGHEQWSPEVESLFGVEPGAFAGRFEAFLRMVHPEDRDRFLGEYAARAERGYPPFTSEFRIVRGDGEVRWIEARGTGIPGPDGRVTRVIGVCSDITERKASKAALVEASAKLAAALKSSHLLLFRQGPDLAYTWIANPAFGLSPAQVIGHTDEELLGEATAAPITEIKRRVLRTGMGERREIRVERADGFAFFELIVEPETDAGGGCPGLVCAAFDITERRRAEREREAMHRQLRELAAHQSDAIEAERGAVAKDVHDQVGAMLTGIAMKLSSIADRLPPGERAIREELSAVAALARSTLEATREICARLRPAVLDDLGLAEACRWYVREWEATSGIAVTARLEPLDPEPGDALRTDLFRILQELLTNVARHAKARGVTVCLACSRGDYRLRVSDDGAGMPAGSRGGFGHSGMRERARRHGGRIDIETSGAGTTVTATLPKRRSP